MNYSNKTNDEWVADVIYEVDQKDGKVYRCIEHRCEPLPPHSHKNRLYLMYSRERLDSSK